MKSLWPKWCNTFFVLDEIEQSETSFSWPQGIFHFLVKDKPQFTIHKHLGLWTIINLYTRTYIYIRTLLLKKYLPTEMFEMHKFINYSKKKKNTLTPAHMQTKHKLLKLKKETTNERESEKLET